MRCSFNREVITIAIEQVETVIERLSSDKAFRVKYCQDPDKTLESYLTPEEIHAIKTGDGHSFEVKGQGDAWRKITETLCGPDPGP